MFRLYADKSKLSAQQREPVTSGSVNVYVVQFEFSEDWTGLERTAVFRNSHSEVRSVLLDETNECVIPWEALTLPRTELLAGVYGTRDGEIVLPTVWASLGTILEGVTIGEAAQEPTPGIYEQILSRAQEATEIARSVQSARLRVDSGTGRLIMSVPDRSTQ